MVPVLPRVVFGADLTLSGEFVAEKSSVLLTWDNSEQADGYEIERTVKDANTWEKIGTSKENSFLDFYFRPEVIYSYRVRKFGGSGYSKQFEFTTPKFEPNVEKDEVMISDATEVLSLSFPVKNNRDPLFVLIENGSENITAPKNKKLISDVYEIKLKNNKGEKVNELDSQITLLANYASVSLRGVKEETIKLVNSNGKQANFLPSTQNQTSKRVITLANSFSNPLFYLLADRVSPWIFVLKILLWVVLFGLIGFGIFVAYRSFQLKKYQKEHEDDFIYRH